MGLVLRFLAVLLTIAAAVAICVVFRFIPGGADFLNDFFWNLLGEIEIFSMASNILQTAIGYKLAPSGQLGITVFAMMIEAMMDGLVMGCCVFVMRAFFAKVNRQFMVGYPGGAWIPTGLGVALGALILTVGGKLSSVADAIFSGVLTIALMIWGILLMLNKRPVRKYYQKRRENNVVRMLIGILGNAATAVCAVLLSTCVLEGPMWVMNGASFSDWFAWLCAGFLLWFTLDSILWVITPRD